eukprot:m.122 g.122  ORF g.122 m.122 type:complete len:115 (+) comp635_c0_seq1:20-364(+)
MSCRNIDIEWSLPQVISQRVLDSELFACSAQFRVSIAILENNRIYAIESVLTGSSSKLKRFLPVHVRVIRTASGLKGHQKLSPPVWSVSKCAQLCRANLQLLRQEGWLKHSSKT